MLVDGQDDLELGEDEAGRLLRLAAAGRGRRKAHLDSVAGAMSSRARTVSPAAASLVRLIALSLILWLPWASQALARAPGRRTPITAPRKWR